MENIEIAAFIFNVLGVWLTSKQYKACWPVNIVAVFLYVIIFYRVNLYADASLQGVFILLQLYGWYSWSKKDHQQQNTINIGYLNKQIWIYSLMVGIASGLMLGGLFNYFTAASLPWLDSMLASFSLVASYWAAKKYIESWGLWCVLDAIYVGVYLHKSLYLTAILYFVFILLALNGWRMWRNLYSSKIQLQHG